MNITVKRIEYKDTYTIGKMYIDGKFECFTLEDKYRGQLEKKEDKIPGATAIPKGVYKLIVDFSNRFKKQMPHILNVPKFEGIRIHSGNTDKDTEGCILVGTNWNGGNTITNSRLAYKNLMLKLAAVQNTAQISVE